MGTTLIPPLGTAQTEQAMAALAQPNRIRLRRASLMRCTVRAGSDTGPSVGRRGSRSSSAWPVRLPRAEGGLTPDHEPPSATRCQ
jgi:hypothetical protein